MVFKKFSIIIAIVGCVAPPLRGMDSSLLPEKSLGGDLEALPLKIQEQIVSNLSFGNLVRLSQTSRGANRLLEDRLAIEILQRIGVGLKKRNLGLNPPRLLFMAIRFKKPKVVRLIFKLSKVSPDQPEDPTKLLWTPLHEAVLRYNRSEDLLDKKIVKEIIQILLDNGANPQIKYITGMSKALIRRMGWYEKQYLGKTPIDLATDKTIKRMLKKKNKKRYFFF